MQPFPKWVGYLASAVAVATTIYTSTHPTATTLPAWLTAMAAVVAQFSHSATGTGGRPE